MIRYLTVSAFLISASVLSSKAQETDSIASEISLSELDSLLTQEDSLAIFTLIDSLLQLEDFLTPLKSQMALRIGYNSNANSASRTLGFNQFGVSSGLSYYHKSGIYGDVSGYWTSEYDPSYYLTILSAGYLGTVLTRWSFLAEYSRYIYTDISNGIVIPYKNNIGVSNFFDLKPVTLRLDYNFLFGERSGHRVLPGIMLNLEKRNWKNIRRILFYPSFSILMGSEQYDEERVQNYSTSLEALMLIRNRQPLFSLLPAETQFGIMNYAFSAPISVSLNNWNFLISYTYNIPKSLPRENSSLNNSGFIAASITRYIRFK